MDYQQVIIFTAAVCSHVIQLMILMIRKCILIEFCSGTHLLCLQLINEKRSSETDWLQFDGHTTAGKSRSWGHGLLSFRSFELS